MIPTGMAQSSGRLLFLMGTLNHLDGVDENASQAPLRSCEGVI